MILVTGADGQLGGDVCSILKEKNIPHLGTTIDSLDITNEVAVQEIFARYKFDAVIHCAAYTAVDKAEEFADVCRKVNTDATGYIARCCREYDAKMLFVSTDYVFDGKGNSPHETDEKKAPLNVYGETKSDAEDIVLSVVPKHFVVRTSWVYGERNTNFIATMLRLSETHSELNVVCDQVGSPTYSKHLASLLFEIIESDKYGVYHGTNEGFCSWAELAKKTFELAGKSVTVHDTLTKDYKTAAVRPLNSRLSKQSLDKSGFHRLPHWECAVAEYLKNIL